MSPPENESGNPIILCLVADDKAVERFPTLIRYLQLGLMDEPIDVILVVPEDSPRAWLETGHATIIKYRRSPWLFPHWNEKALLGSIQEHLNTFQQEPVVLVHALTLTAAPLATTITKELGAELILSVTSTNSLGDPQLQPMIDQARVLIVPSSQVRHAVQASSFAAKPMELVPVGVISEGSPAAFRRADRRPTVVFAGSLLEECGVDTFLRADKIAAQRHPELAVFVIGKGPAETYLRQLSQSLGIMTNVTFTGRIEPWREAIAAADIFCIPRATTPFEEKPLYAMASGLAIIAAEGSKYDGLINEQTALLVEGNEHEALAERLLHLLEHREVGRRLGAAAQAHAKKNHSISQMVTEYARIYRQMASRQNTLSMAERRTN